MRYKAEIGKYYIISLSVVSLLIIFPLIISLIIFNISAIISFSIFFVIMEVILISPVFGYVRLDEDSLYIKYGLILRKHIPYEKIVGLEKEHKIYSESLISLKTSIDHVLIKYNTYDNTTVSVKDMEKFIEEVNQKIALIQAK